MKRAFIILTAGSLFISSAWADSFINDLTAAYSKETTTYTGTNADTLNVNGSTNLILHAGSPWWTMAFSVSNLAVTEVGEVGILFTLNTGSYKNIEGVGYTLTESGTLTLYSGGYSYGGSGTGNAPWAMTVLTSSYSASEPLTFFYYHHKDTIEVMMSDGSTVTTFDSLKSTTASYADNSIVQVNFSAKDTSGTSWNVPNGVTGAYTLNDFNVYGQGLTEAQMKEYATSASIPEPATATLSLLALAGLAARRRRK